MGIAFSIFNDIFIFIFGLSSLGFAFTEHVSLLKIISSLGLILIVVILLGIFENGLKKVASNWYNFKMVLLERGYKHFNLLSNIPLVLHLALLNIMIGIIKVVAILVFLIPLMWMSIYFGSAILMVITFIIIMIPAIVVGLALSQSTNIYMDDFLNNKYITTISAVTQSVRSMNGLKSKLFLLELSFLPWYLLVTFICYLASLLPSSLISITIIAILVTVITFAIISLYQSQSIAIFYNDFISSNNSNYISPNRLYTYQPMNNNYNQYNNQSYNSNNEYY